MMGIRRGIGGVAAVALGVALLGACSSDDKKTNTTPQAQDVSTLDCANPNIPMGEFRKRCETPAPGAPGTPGTPGTPSGAPSASASASSSAAPSVANVGDTLNVSHSDQDFQVTLVQIVDPATPANEYSKADDGGRLVAIQWRVTNTSSKPLSASPASFSKLIDDQGQVFDFSIGGRAQGVEYPAMVQIPPGDSRLGFVTYEVPQNTKLVKVEFSGGYGKPNAEWRLS
ncbi:DUF4352 domain-containing protein [Yinghuangia soli]|uniref:DUF4352 domain-containing protein n=1 Tax=Yinghuangia soli TaxID=2908204 RepID=A0AA41PVU3_9ACTN|nr:DUF4352 domain-containing protein [Yinghuangia soli]MCF2526280.1 DUF4352 domain-containing protein [Yinghuangia soli]